MPGSLNGAAGRQRDDAFVFLFAQKGGDGTQQNGAPDTGTGTPANGTSSAETDPVRGIQRLITQSFAEQEAYTLTGYDVVYYVNDLNRANSEVLTASTQEAEKAAQSPQAGTDDENYIYGVQRLYAEREGSTETYLYDGRGSVIQLLQGGTVSQSYSYNAYGYINTDEYGIQAPFYGYNGEQHDPATGLQDLRARYYAPQNGSFTTQDSFAGLLTDALSQNSYTYAQNNPVTFADPSGHSIWDSIKNGITQAANTVKNTFNSAVTSVKNAITGTTTQTVANTSSATAKKPYTAPLAMSVPSPVYQKSTYSSGAAKAAQNARISAVTNSSLSGLLENSHLPQQPFQKDVGPIPVLIQDFTESAEAFIRKGCDESAQWLKTQGEWLWDKASKVPGAMWELWETAAQMAYENQQNQLQYEQESTKLILKYCVLPELYREKDYFSDKSGVITQGLGGSGTFGTWSIKGSILIAVDWHGTIAVQTSYGMDGTTGGAGLSANYMFSYIHAPEVKNTEGDAYDIGGSFYKIFGGGGEIIIAPDSEEEGKNYLGIAGQIGYGGGGEVHAGFSTTDTIWSINISDYLIDLIESVV